MEGEIIKSESEQGETQRWAEWARRLADLIPPEGFYYVAVKPDGTRSIHATEESAAKALASSGGTVVRNPKASGLRTLALATRTRLEHASPTVTLENVDGVTWVRIVSEYEAIVVALDKDLQPKLAIASVVVGNDRTVAPGTGAAFAGERSFARPGDVVMLAETRALNRALRAAHGGAESVEQVRREIRVPDAIPDLQSFLRFLKDNGIALQEAQRILGKGLADVSDFREAALIIASAV